MKYISNILITFLFLSLVACGHNKTAELKAEEKAMAAPIEGQSENLDRKLIKEGQLDFEVSDLAEARQTIYNAVSKYKAYVSSDQEFKSPGRRSNTIIIRIPADNFENLLKDATEGIEKFERKEITVKDVTEEFLDVEARLKTKKELESRYAELLKQAKTVTEMLEIEKQMGELRTEIESIEGRLKYLQSQVSYSTLTLTFYESIADESAFGQKFSDGFSNGWNNLILFFIFFTNIWPFILIGLALFFGIRIYKRKKQ